MNLKNTKLNHLRKVFFAAKVQRHLVSTKTKAKKAISSVLLKINKNNFGVMIKDNGDSTL